MQKSDPNYYKTKKKMCKQAVTKLPFCNKIWSLST